MQETQETWVQSLGREDPMEEETATMGRSHGGGNSNHSSNLAWKTVWTEETGGLQS